MSKQYYNITVNLLNNNLEFHTGTDKEAVSEGKSLNHAVSLTANPERIQFLINDWMWQVKLYDMEISV